MKKSNISDIGKKRIGRPPVNAVAVLVRIPPAEVEPIDAWMAKQKEPMTRPEAIRRLVELGLMAQAPTKLIRRSTPNRLRAKELATKAIDKMIDPSAPLEERAERRRRLTKGPPEFRDDRVDLPKAKGK